MKFDRCKVEIKEMILGLSKIGVGQLPVLQEIAKQCEVSPRTALKALDELKAEGWVESVRGKGFFIKRTKKNQLLIKIFYVPSLDLTRALKFGISVF